MANRIISNRYELLKQIGSGGMSEVYLAYDTVLNKQWAIKKVRFDKIKEKVYLESFEKEVNVIRNLNSSYFPRIVDLIQKDEEFFIVMDYIEGETLSQKLHEHGPQSQELVIQYGIQLCEALSYLHHSNPPIIYRDMKPSNIMITPENKVRLIDFGTAREFKEDQVSDTTILGTRGYAAPEQYSKDTQSDARTDIYSLGMTLFHAVTGENPAVISDRHPITTYNPNLSTGLEKIIEKSLNTNPSQRYQTASEMQFDLENYLDLDNEMIKKEKNKIFGFSLVIVLLIISIVIMFIGKNNMRQTILSQYYTKLTQATQLRVQEKYVEAIGAYDDAILKIDGKISDAYFQLIDLYKLIDFKKQANGNELRSGLDKIEGYITQNVDNVQSNESVLMKLGTTYFTDLKNYEKALYYFNKVKKRKEGKYYKDISYLLVSLDVDFSQLNNQLELFEKYTDSLNDNLLKIENYSLIDSVYSSYKNKIENANDKIIAMNEKIEKVVRLLNDEEYANRYDIRIFERKAQAYYSKFIETKQVAFANKALDFYKKARAVSFNENNYIESATILYYLNDYTQADKILKEGTTKTIHPEYIYVKWIYLLMETEFKKTTESRNYDQIRSMFVTLKSIKDPKNLAGIQRLENELKYAEIVR